MSPIESEWRDMYMDLQLKTVEAITMFFISSMKKDNYMISKSIDAMKDVIDLITLQSYRANALDAISEVD